MAQEKHPKRQCERFEIFGATLCYKKKNLLFFTNKYSDELSPILDISRGGLRFVSQSFIKPDTRITMKIIDANSEELLVIEGVVVWSSINPGKSYPFQVGVLFHPYGKKKGYNSLGCLEKIIELEGLFSKEQ